MQKMAIVLSVAALMSAGALARTYRTDKTGDQQGNLASSNHSFSNPPPAAETARLNAAFVPSTKAEQNARQLFREGKLAEAEVECRRAIAIAPLFNGKPFDGTALPLLGDILLAQGHNHDALECYLRIVTSSVPDDPQKPKPNLNAALAYCRLGNFEMAKKYAPDQVLINLTDNKSLADWPGTSDIHALEASLLMVRGFDLASSAQHLEALSYLEPASKLAPKNWLIARAMGNVLCDLKRYKEAASYFLRAEQQGGKIAYEEHQLAHPEKYLSVPAKR